MCAIPVLFCGLCSRDRTKIPSSPTPPTQSPMSVSPSSSSLPLLQVPLSFAPATNTCSLAPRNSRLSMSICERQLKSSRSPSRPKHPFLLWYSALFVLCDLGRIIWGLLGDFIRRLCNEHRQAIDTQFWRNSGGGVGVSRSGVRRKGWTKANRIKCLCGAQIFVRLVLVAVLSCCWGLPQAWGHPYSIASMAPYNPYQHFAATEPGEDSHQPSYTSLLSSSSSSFSSAELQLRFLEKSSLTTIASIARKFRDIAERDSRFVHAYKALFHTKYTESSTSDNERVHQDHLYRIQQTRERDLISGHSRYVYFQYFSSVHCQHNTESATIGMATGACLPLGSGSYRLHFDADNCSDLSMLLYRDLYCREFLGNAKLQHQDVCIADREHTLFAASRIVCARSSSVPVKFPSVVSGLQQNKTTCTGKADEFATLRTGICHEELAGDQSFQLQCESSSGFSRTTFVGDEKCSGSAYEHEKQPSSCASLLQVQQNSTTLSTNGKGRVAGARKKTAVVHAKAILQTSAETRLVCEPFSLDDYSEKHFESCAFEVCDNEAVNITTSHYFGGFCTGDITLEVFIDKNDSLVTSNDNFFGNCPKVSFVSKSAECEQYTLVQACKDGESCRGQVVISRVRLSDVTEQPEDDNIHVREIQLHRDPQTSQKLRCDSYTKDPDSGSATCVFEACDEVQILISACGEQGGYCYGNAMFAVYDSALDNVGFSEEFCGSCPLYRFTTTKQCQTYSIIQYCINYDYTCGGQLTVSEVIRPPSLLTISPAHSVVLQELQAASEGVTSDEAPLRASSGGCRNSFGSDFCGGFAYGSSAVQSCYCDDACCRFGDCCSNKVEVCGGCSDALDKTQHPSLSSFPAPRHSPRSMDLLCGLYRASNTDSAKSNFATCALQLCAGESLIVTGIEECLGDQYFRLLDEDSNQVAHNDDFRGLCSQLTYSYPADMATTEPYCRTFTLRKGCYGASECGGNVKVQVVAQTDLSDTLMQQHRRLDQREPNIDEALMRLFCVDQVPSPLYFLTQARHGYLPSNHSATRMALVEQELEAQLSEIDPDDLDPQDNYLDLSWIKLLILITVVSLLCVTYFYYKHDFAILSSSSPVSSPSKHRA